MKGGDRALQLPDRAEHDAAADRRRGPRSRPQRSRAHPRRDGDDQDRGRLQGHPRPVLRVSAHRSASSSRQSKEWMTQALLRDRQDASMRASARCSRPCPRPQLEIRAVPAFSREDRGRRLVSRAARRTARAPASSITTPMTCRRGRRSGMETLYLHEGAPGHHFQISLAQENAALPDFMRFGGNTAFVEGWALYAETLWDELGMETDPYQRFGGLDDEMLRAMRLVVDTGIHAKGWTRDQAIHYMLDNSGDGRRPTPPPRSSATSPFPARRSPTSSASSRSSSCARGPKQALGPTVRPARIPRPGADDRRAAADRARARRSTTGSQRSSRAEPCILI